MKRLLLDTHLLIWSLSQSDGLPLDLRRRVESPDLMVLFSSISIWEIAIKIRLGRADFDVEPDAVAQAALAAGFGELRVGWQAAALVAKLPMHHRDPFDRILIAQAITEQVPLYSADRKLAGYSELVQLV